MAQYHLWIPEDRRGHLALFHQYCLAGRSVLKDQLLLSRPEFLVVLKVRWDLSHPHRQSDRRVHLVLFPPLGLKALKVPSHQHLLALKVRLAPYFQLVRTAR